MAATAWSDFRDDAGDLFDRQRQRLHRCVRCAGRTRGLTHPTLGLVCSLCGEQLAVGRRMRSKDVRRAQGKTHTPPRKLPDLVDGSGTDPPGSVLHEFLRDDGGNPLGRGMPSGGPLREDGESHRSGWTRLMRADPCSYCGGRGGTVDHVEPKRKPVRGLGGPHVWLNLTGACEGCNGSKADKSLLLWLVGRPVRARPHPPLVKTPASARNVALREARRAEGRTPAKDRRLAREAAGLPPGGRGTVPG